ncbi:MAG TPA: hypothetical protein VJT09_01650 [Pyrinomonadaceae bacterium]|nr:hypothetical protein [Pyrinomonadaceae bacterium]
MKRLSSYATSILILILLAGCCLASRAQSGQAKLPRSMKGYELYSWKVRGEWYFSLLVGTNRLKTYKEVTSPKVRLKGVTALKSKLAQLSEGEEVSWAATLAPRTILPPDGIIEDLRSYCERHGIILRVPPLD